MTRLTLATSLCLTLALPSMASADWMVKPFAGLASAISDGYINLDGSRTTKMVLGGAAGWRWASGLGAEVEVALSPTMLKGSSDLVSTGRVITTMVNASWLLPWPTRIRAHVSGGIGVARVNFKDALEAFTAASSLAAANVGGGVLLPVSRRAQVDLDGRYFRTRYGDPNASAFGEPYVAFWRFSTGLVFGF